MGLGVLYLDMWDFWTFYCQGHVGAWLLSEWSGTLHFYKEPGRGIFHINK